MKNCKNTELKELISKLCNQGENMTPFLIEYYSAFIASQAQVRDRSTSFSLAFQISFELEKLSALSKKSLALPSTVNRFEKISRVIGSYSASPGKETSSPVEKEKSIELETLLINFGEKRFGALDYLVEEETISFDLFRIFNVIFHRLKHHDRDGLMVILHFLTSQKSLQTMRVDVPAYPEIAHIRFCRNDVVWYLWRLLFDWIHLKYGNLEGKKEKEKGEKSNKEIIRDYVTHELRIFSTFFQKKFRNQRLQILVGTFLVLCDSNEVKRLIHFGKEREREKNLYFKNNEKVLTNKNENNFEENENDFHEVEVENEYHQKKEKESEKDKKEMNLFHMKEKEESKRNYLMCFTYFDENSEVEVKKDRIKNRSEYKEFSR